MRTDSREFNLSGLERVVSGAGSVERLSHEMERRGLERAVVVTGRTLGASGLLERITGPLGGRCVAVSTAARQHVPSCSVVKLAQLLEEQRADTVISFGGGSPIDTAKAAIYNLIVGGRVPAGAKPPAHIAIPTTLSAGEFTAVAGITDEKTRVKRPVSDSRLTPRTVIADPTLTLETPAWLWAASGIRALDHAIESIYSVRHYPVSDAAASSGLTMLLQHLRPSLDTRGRLCARASRRVPAGRVDVRVRRHQRRLRAVACARSSDRPAMERAARDDVVHHAPARDALHGRLCGRSISADRRRLWCSVRHRRADTRRAGVRRPRRGVHRPVRRAAAAAGRRRSRRTSSPRLPTSCTRSWTPPTSSIAR